MADPVFDFCGLVCPMPVLKTKKAIKTVEPGERIEVLTDDPHAVADIRTFAEQSGHAVIAQQKQGEKVRHVLARRVKDL